MRGVTFRLSFTSFLAYENPPGSSPRWVYYGHVGTGFSAALRKDELKIASTFFLSQTREKVHHSALAGNPSG